MNIAFFSRHLPSDTPNGVSCQVHRLASQLVTDGHRVVCHSFSPKPGNAAYEHQHLAYASVSRLGRLFDPARVFRGIDTREFDIAHYHGDDYLCPGSRHRVRTFYGSALDEALHARTGVRRARQLLFHALEWASCVRRGTCVGISCATRRALPLVRMTIPCGVPLDVYTPRAGKAASPTVLFVGDLDSRKRGRELLRAFERVVLPAHPSARLIVVGPQSCSGSGIQYAGRVSEERLVQLYQQAWVYCMPSSYEGFGVPLVEAMACATPVVACRSAGACEIVTHERDGLLCDMNGLGEALVRVLSSQPLRDTLTCGGLLTARRFDIRDIASEYAALYRHLAGEAA